MGNNFKRRLELWYLKLKLCRIQLSEDCYIFFIFCKKTLFSEEDSSNFSRISKRIKRENLLEEDETRQF
ncbi:hypothetical protein TNCT_531591 [Trichonephila clavata]|uniref:Uncharacterized protein n=1 Tax=Trichonephila clavata TaxID=2740835 RepID=A0A8X6GLM6_TRICU|nr:hypothetical protein TNCT_531591 [Trichonephila clavata]